MPRPHFDGEFKKGDEYLTKQRKQALEVLQKPIEQWTDAERLLLIGVIAYRIREVFLTTGEYAVPGTPTAETICHLAFASFESGDLDSIMSFLEKEREH